MGNLFSRSAAIDAIDTETGEFPVTAATDGEASDGHILSIRGLELPDEMPLQLDHRMGAQANLGTVSGFTKDRREGRSRARGMAQIRLTGSGDQLEARRDLVDGIEKGSIRAVSLTWDAIDSPVERASLPKDHPAHVSSNEKNYRKRYGLFFGKSRAVELSLVGVGMDSAALIGRVANAPNDAAREMWQTLIDGAADRSSRSADYVNALETRLAELEARQREAAEPVSDPLPEPLPELGAFLRGLEAESRSEATRVRDTLRETFGDLFADLTGRQYDGRGNPD